MGQTPGTRPPASSSTQEVSDQDPPLALDETSDNPTQDPPWYSGMSLGTALQAMSSEGSLGSDQGSLGSDQGVPFEIVFTRNPAIGSGHAEDLNPFAPGDRVAFGGTMQERRSLGLQPGGKHFGTVQHCVGSNQAKVAWDRLPVEQAFICPTRLLSVWTDPGAEEPEQAPARSRSRSPAREGSNVVDPGVWNPMFSLMA